MGGQGWGGGWGSSDAVDLGQRAGRRKGTGLESSGAAHPWRPASRSQVPGARRQARKAGVGPACAALGVGGRVSLRAGCHHDPYPQIHLGPVLCKVPRLSTPGPNLCWGCRRIVTQDTSSQAPAGERHPVLVNTCHGKGPELCPPVRPGERPGGGRGRHILVRPVGFEVCRRCPSARAPRMGPPASGGRVAPLADPP